MKEKCAIIFHRISKPSISGRKEFIFKKEDFISRKYSAPEIPTIGCGDKFLYLQHIIIAAERR
jgi:hypothetical protein